MKYHTQFITHNPETDTYSDALGSDGVYILDGRNNLDTMIADSHKRMKQLQKVRNFDGFIIKQGNLKHNIVLYIYKQKG